MLKGKNLIKRSGLKILQLIYFLSQKQYFCFGMEETCGGRGQFDPSHFRSPTLNTKVDLIGLQTAIENFSCKLRKTFGGFHECFSDSSSNYLQNIARLSRFYFFYHIRPLFSDRTSLVGLICQKIMLIN